MRSKGQPYSDYADVFKSQNIDGNRLINTANEEEVFTYRRARKGDQQKICGAIRELKDVITMKFYQQFCNDDFALPITVFGTSENIKSCIIRPNTSAEHKHAYHQIISWLGNLPEDIAIEKIQLIAPNNRFRGFLKQISTIDSQPKQHAFMSRLGNEKYLQTRQAVLNRLRSLTKEVKHRQSVSIARLW